MLVQLTQNAVKEIKRIIEEQSISVDKTYVRVGVKGGGCSGFSYAFNLDETYNEDKDNLFEQDGLNIVVDKKSCLYLDGTVVDWKEDLNIRGFSFSNPNSVSTCGCKKSFAV